MGSKARSPGTCRSRGSSISSFPPFRPARLSVLKRHRRRLGSCPSSLEIVPRFSHPEHLGGQVIGKAPNVGVVLANGRVVVLAGHGDAVLRAFQLVLELPEVLAR